MVGQLHLARAVWGPAPLSAALMVPSFSLPAGTTTFVSADVVGSASRWEGGDDDAGEAMKDIDAVFSGAVGRHGGVQPVGQRGAGSLLAAFARASEALACALDVQRELQANRLSCLRAGLHTGEAQVRDEVRYFGQAVARTARLRDLGHGGQVLVSRASADLVADHLPAGATLVDLGAHRMHDLSRPVQVYQLCHPNLASGFPPLDSLDRHPHNLAVQLTSFVGRETAVAELGGLLARHGLVTVTGSGGCGKTRLALQVAAEALGAQSNEAWFVDLSALADPGLVPGAVMGAMGLQEVSDQTLTETLMTQLADRDALIVLDNCEHVLSAVAALAQTLARSCGRLALLATSREPLGVAGEVVWRVPCLSVPEEQGGVDIESLDASEAVRLFIDRARAARPNFAITNDNAPAVAAICSRLDGIPLAIELAAARTRMMSAERIAKALADRFHLLAGGVRGAVPRQATLRASVDWSYELLPEPERALLRRLSVFAGGFSLDAAEHVGAGGEVGNCEVLGLLSALVDKSLVQVNDPGDRYRLLETIREYAAEELVGSGEEQATRDRHLSFYAALAEHAEKAMWTSAIASWLGVFDTEQDNLRAALDWSLVSEQLDTGARLVYGMAPFLLIRGPRTEGRRRLDEVLRHDLAPARRAKLYYWAAIFASSSDPAARRRYGEEMVRLGRELGDDTAVARGLGQVGVVQSFSDPLAALDTLREAVATARAVNDGNLVICLCASADASYLLGRFRDGLQAGEEALAVAQRTDFMWGAGLATASVAAGALDLGELDRASEAASALMELAHDLDDESFMQTAHRCRGVLGMYRSQRMADEAFAAALRLAQGTHDDAGTAGIGYEQGYLALALGKADEARRMLEAVLPMADRSQPIFAARTRCLLSEAAMRKGELVQARDWLEAAQALPFADQLFLATRAKARLARARGDHHLAAELAAEGLYSAHHSGAQVLAVDFLELAALVATDTARYIEAGRLLAAATEERARLGYVRFVYDQADVDIAIAKIEATLGSSASVAAWSQGAGLALDEAIAYARRGRGGRGRPSRGWASLTPTERRVVGLVVEGMSNAEIAKRMFVSTATVKSHLNHVYDKLGVTDRRQLVGAARLVSS